MSVPEKKDEREAPPARPASGLRPRTKQPEEPIAERADDDHALSESRLDEDAQQLAYLLDEASRWLTRVPAGPLRVELDATLERYRQTVNGWAYRNPSATQRAILLHGVQILRRAIAGRASDPDISGPWTPSKK